MTGSSLREVQPEPGRWVRALSKVEHVSIVLPLSQSLICRMAQLSVSSPRPELDFRDQGRMNPEDIVVSNVTHWWLFLFPPELVEHLSKPDGLSLFETRADVADIDKPATAVCGKRQGCDPTG